MWYVATSTQHFSPRVKVLTIDVWRSPLSNLVLVLADEPNSTRTMGIQWTSFDNVKTLWDGIYAIYFLEVVSLFPFTRAGELRQSGSVVHPLWRAASSLPKAERTEVTTGGFSAVGWIMGGWRHLIESPFALQGWKEHNLGRWKNVSPFFWSEDGIENSVLHEELRTF